jgi:hypothetical protein
MQINNCMNRAQKQMSSIARENTFDLLVSGLCRQMRHTLLFGKPLRAFTTKVVIEKYNWLRAELRYGNNVKDWAIRMLTT